MGGICCTGPEQSLTRIRMPSIHIDNLPFLVLLPLWQTNLGATILNLSFDFPNSKQTP